MSDYKAIEAVSHTIGRLIGTVGQLVDVFVMSVRANNEILITMRDAILSTSDLAVDSYIQLEQVQSLSNEQQVQINQFNTVALNIQNQLQDQRVVIDSILMVSDSDDNKASSFSSCGSSNINSQSNSNRKRFIHTPTRSGRLSKLRKIENNNAVSTEEDESSESGSPVHNFSDDDDDLDDSDYNPEEEERKENELVAQLEAEGEADEVSDTIVYDTDQESNYSETDKSSETADE